MEVREYTEFDATGLKELIDKGEVTADEVREAAVAAIEEVQPRLNALAGPLLDRPVAGSSDGLFAGVPFVIKDLVCSAEGVAQESGSRLFARADGGPEGFDCLPVAVVRAHARHSDLGIELEPEQGNVVEVVSFHGARLSTARTSTDRPHLPPNPCTVA